MKVVVYVRTHTDIMPNNKIMEQKEKCYKYCEQRGFEIIEEYIDTDDKKSLEALIKDCKTKKFQAIVMTSPDRITRNIREFYEYLEILKKNEVDLLITDSDEKEIEEYITFRKIINKEKLKNIF